MLKRCSALRARKQVRIPSWCLHQIQTMPSECWMKSRLTRTGNVSPAICCAIFVSSCDSWHQFAVLIWQDWRPACSSAAVAHLLRRLWIQGFSSVDCGYNQWLSKLLLQSCHSSLTPAINNLLSPEELPPFSKKPYRLRPARLTKSIKSPFWFWCFHLNFSNLSWSCLHD